MTYWHFSFSLAHDSEPTRHMFKIMSANSRLGIIKYTFQKIERDGFSVLHKSMVRLGLAYLFDSNQFTCFSD